LNAGFKTMLIVEGNRNRGDKLRAQPQQLFRLDGMIFENGRRFRRVV